MNDYIDYYSHAGYQWHTSGSWGYTDWRVYNLDVSALSGHNFTLTVLASDCGWGGHGGYAYFDGFGAVDPTVPEPASILLLGSGLVGLAARLRRRK